MNNYPKPGCLLKSKIPVYVRLSYDTWRLREQIRIDKDELFTLVSMFVFFGPDNVMLVKRVGINIVYRDAIYAFCFSTDVVIPSLEYGMNPVNGSFTKKFWDKEFSAFFRIVP